MVKNLEIQEHNFDKTALKYALSEYKKFKNSEDYDEEYKWEVIREINQWLSKNEINENTVKEFAEKLREHNPSKGTLVHWTELDNFIDFTEENPEKASEITEQLFDENKPVKERIKDFRNQLDLGTSFFGYVLSSHDNEKYAPFKQNVVQEFLNNFVNGEPPKLGGLSPAEKYKLFIEICKGISEFLSMETEGGTSALEAQDFIYCVTASGYNVKYNFMLKYLRNFSKKLEEHKKNPKELLEEIKKLPKNYLEERKEFYEDAEEEPVREIRHIILTKILENKKIDLEEIKREVKEQYEGNVLGNWTNFRILCQIYLDYIKKRQNQYFETITKKIIDEMKDENLDFHVVSFQGAQNHPTTEAWVAIYPKSKENHKKAQLLVLFIDSNRVRYGLDPGYQFEGGVEDKEEILNEDEIDIIRIIQALKKREDRFYELNRKPQVWTISPGRSGSQWKEWKNKNIISIGWDELGSAKKLSKEEIKEKISLLEGKENPKNDVFSIYSFANDIKSGDIIIAKQGQSKKMYGIGVVTENSEYQYEENRDRYKHIIGNIEWLIKSKNQPIILKNLNKLFAQSTLTYYVDYDNKESYYDLIEKLEEYLSKSSNKSELEINQKKSEDDINELQRRLFSIIERYGESSYFWISSNPSIWDVSKIKGGEEVFYTAYNKKGNKRRIYRNFEDAKPGDKVIFYEGSPTKSTVAEGEITRGLHKEKEKGYQSKKVKGISIKYVRPMKKISWKELTQKPDLNESEPIKNRAQGSLFKLTKKEYRTILPEPPIETEEEKLIEIINSKLTFENLDITKGLYFPEKMESEIEKSVKAALESGKHIIFTGPPGTGKTKIAKNLAKEVKNKNKTINGYILTTATADWSTFDTIGGYQPSKTEEELVFKPGQFLRCFKEKEKGKPKNKWLVIDEINRADIDKAFGQLFSVLSRDSVKLPFTNKEEEDIEIKYLESIDPNNFKYSDWKYYVTPNWRLLATMNTYDKASLYEMSYAFMRRFAFIDVSIPTNEEIDNGIMKKYIKEWDKVNKEDIEKYLDSIIEVWKTLNKEKRSIGPAIIRDMLLFLNRYEDDEISKEITQALKLYVLPQLEGMIKSDQKKIFKAFIDKEIGNKTELEKVARERFEIDEIESSKG